MVEAVDARAVSVVVAVLAFVGVAAWPQVLAGTVPAVVAELALKDVAIRESLLALSLAADLLARGIQLALEDAAHPSRIKLDELEGPIPVVTILDATEDVASLLQHDEYFLKLINDLEPFIPDLIHLVAPAAGTLL